MLIFYDKRLVFLATPKAGSTAVEAALEPLASVAVQRPAALKHVDITGFNAHVRPWLHAAAGEGAGFTTMALMREPIDWLRSWYRFRQRDDMDDPDHPMDGISFDAFAQAWLDDSTAAARVGRQTDYLTGAAGVRIDHIFRYEHIESFTDFLDDCLDCAIVLPRVNVPPPVDVTLSPDTEARLRSALADDLAIYAAL